MARCCCAALGLSGVGGAAALALEHGGGDLVHRGARGRELALRALADLLARQRREQRERQLLVVELGAQAEIALGFGREPLLEPDLVLRHRAARLRDAGAQRVLLIRRAAWRSARAISPSSIEFRPAFCFAAVSACTFGTRAGSSTSRTCARKRGSSSSRLPRFFRRSGSGREFARQQVVQAVAGDARVDQRIPAPVLQRLEFPAVVLRDRGAAAARRPGWRATASRGRWARAPLDRAR